MAKSMKMFELVTKEIVNLNSLKVNPELFSF